MVSTKVGDRLGSPCDDNLFILLLFMHTNSLFNSKMLTRILSLGIDIYLQYKLKYLLFISAIRYNRREDQKYECEL